MKTKKCTYNYNNAKSLYKYLNLCRINCKIVHCPFIKYIIMYCKHLF